MTISTPPVSHSPRVRADVQGLGTPEPLPAPPRRALPHRGRRRALRARDRGAPALDCGRTHPAHHPRAHARTRLPRVRVPPSQAEQPAGAPVRPAGLGDVPVWDHEAAGVCQDAAHRHLERGLPERGGDGQARAVAAATAAAHFRAPQVYEGDDSAGLSEACCALTQGCEYST